MARSQFAYGGLRHARCYTMESMTGVQIVIGGETYQIVALDAGQTTGVVLDSGKLMCFGWSIDEVTGAAHVLGRGQGEWRAPTLIKALRLALDIDKETENGSEDVLGDEASGQGRPR